MILRAGLIGLGSMGRHHARVLRTLQGVELVAVADPGGDPHKVADDFEVLRSVEEVVAAGVDYVVVAAPTEAHASIAVELAEAGVHALVEKPLAFDVEEAYWVANAFERAGLIGAVGHIERYNPALQALRKRLDLGALGEVFQVATRRQGPFPPRIADVGVVKDLATHDIDLTAWITRQQYSKISARTAYKSGREHEDLVAVTAELSGGVIANHLVNWLSPMKERSTIVTGEKGTFVADTVLADLTFFANGVTGAVWEDLAQFGGVTEGDVTRFAIPKPEPLRSEHEAFRDALLGREADIVSFSDGLEVVRVAESILHAAQVGATVTLDGNAYLSVGSPQ